MVARLTEVEVKTIGHTETTTEMGALVETLSDPLMKMKSRRRSTLRIIRVAKKKVELIGDTLAVKRKRHFSTH